MTKTKAKRSITKASTSKTSATKTSSPTSDDICLLVLGFDEQQKPCGARFVGDKPDLVAKAAQLMGLKVYKASSPDVADVAKKLPVGRLYANGRGFVPNVRQTLYSDVIVALAAEPQQAAVGTGRRQGQHPGRPRPAAELGRDRAWPSRHRPREPRQRVVGGHRARPQRRHAHAAVSRLPAAAQVLSASHRGRADESCQRSVSLALSKSARVATAARAPCPLNRARTSHHPHNLEVQSWTRRLRAFAR